MRMQSRPKAKQAKHARQATQARYAEEVVEEEERKIMLELHSLARKRQKLLEEEQEAAEYPSSLEGCVIWPLPSLPASVKVDLRKILLCSGAVYSVDLTQLVTHVVVAKLSSTNEARLSMHMKTAAYPLKRQKPRMISIGRLCATVKDQHGMANVNSPGEKISKPRVCVSGYAGSDRKRVRSLCGKLDFEFTDVLSRSCTHLVCNAGFGKKFEKARKWGIPIISLSWLDACNVKHMAVPVNEEFVVRPQGSIPGFPGHAAFLSNTDNQMLASRGVDAGRNPGRELPSQSQGSEEDSVRWGPS